MNIFVTTPIGKPVRKFIGSRLELLDELPQGLALIDGYVVGVAETPQVSIIRALDPASQEVELVVSAVRIVELDKNTVEQEDFVSQLQTALADKASWAKSTLSTTRTIVELIAAVGTYNTSRILRAVEEAFPDTAQSPSSLRATAVMQGVRLARQVPAAIRVSLSNPTKIFVPTYTQFTLGQISLFNREAFELTSTPQNFMLFEGQIHIENCAGLGKELQSFISREDGFRVSDQDVAVTLNGQVLTRVTDGLWNCEGQPAFEDVTLPDGRMKVGFGRAKYGAVPALGEAISITYATTNGAKFNGRTGTAVACGSFPQLTGNTVGVLEGGTDPDVTVLYKTNAAGHFGAHGSAVTKAQYQSLVKRYPGVVDATILAQVDIDPTDYKRMNCMQLTAVTSRDWSKDEVQAYCDYVRGHSKYGPHIEWVPPEAVPVDVKVTVYSRKGIDSGQVQDLAKSVFEPCQGMLGTTKFLASDVSNALRQAIPDVLHVMVSPGVLFVKPTQFNTLGTLEVSVEVVS